MAVGGLLLEERSRVVLASEFSSENVPFALHTKRHPRCLAELDRPVCFHQHFLL